MHDTLSLLVAQGGCEARQLLGKAGAMWAQQEAWASRPLHCSGGKDVEEGCFCLVLVSSGRTPLP